ncbi:hypothetical protein [Algoriphagus antarcticus]|uniref:Lipoprotein n=1 Tax=Algoriphagus antarcticus TaxID=238540 RepID=A0A3E0DMY7_9BACT|nr:hypothetical protein [Algoriphagus antarcticus]REG84066.1 hypothetical protein C8N25_116121 [Algoriphagus antarcticus]
MKKSFNFFTLFLLMFGAILVSSCNDDSAPVPDLSVVNEDTEVNRTFEDLNNLTLTVLSNSGLSARTTANIPSGNLCEGALVTLDEAKKKITVDFGEGCTSAGGVTRKGIVMLSYTGNLLFTGAKITTTFDGYEVDGLKVEGTRTLINKGANLETNTISLDVKIQNGKVTWPDATFVTLTSDQVRDIKLSAQGGYEASVTGNATGTSRNGFEYTSSVTQALTYEKSCIDSGVNVPLSGILEFQFRGIEASVDYGDGACDKLATIFYPDGSKPVTLD